MRVLIGCEESGNTREAFNKLGHDAWSCDIKPSRIPSPKHIQSDVIQAINTCGPWDLIILHPDCTYLTVSGNRWYGEQSDKHFMRQGAILWVEHLWKNACRVSKRVALENPIGVLSTQSYLGKPTQIIHPWQFGHGETKATCLWLHGLPLLEPTNVVEGREQRIWKMAPNENRKRDRSETYSGWSEAMAEQWGNLNVKED